MKDYILIQVESEDFNIGDIVAIDKKPSNSFSDDEIVFFEYAEVWHHDKYEMVKELDISFAKVLEVIES